MAHCCTLSYTQRPRDPNQHEVANDDKMQPETPLMMPYPSVNRSRFLSEHAPWGHIIIVHPNGESLDGSSSSHSLEHWYRSAGVLATSEEPVSQANNLCTDSSFPIATSLCLLNGVA
jgi:hypothetical protein